MDLRKRAREYQQEAKLSVKNPTNDDTFRKLTAVYLLVKRKKNSAHALTEYFLGSSDECGLIIRSKYKQHPSATNSCILMPNGMYQFRSNEDVCPFLLPLSDSSIGLLMLHARAMSCSKVIRL